MYDDNGQSIRSSTAPSGVRTRLARQLATPRGATLACACLAVAAALLVLGMRAAPAVATPRPNVVLIITDDQTQTPDMLFAMPNTRELIADAGTTFSNSFVTTALCCPARATLFSGQYAHNHGVWDNIPPNGGFAKFDNTNTLATWLRDAGYTTALVGKYLNGYGLTDPTAIPPGWSEWYGAVGDSEAMYYDYTLNENGALVTYGTGPAAYSTDVYMGKAVDFIQRHAADSAPYFLYVAVNAPHTDHVTEETIPAPQDVGAFASAPLPRPPSYDERDVSDKPRAIRQLPLLTAQDTADITTHNRTRLESLLSVDRGVQAIVTALQASGKLGNTLLIFTSDNGYEQGEHRLKVGKKVMYEESIRVPLLVRGPGVPVQKLSQLVANIDLAPTLVHLAGATPRRVMDGRSLVPLVRNASTPWRSDLLIEGPNQQFFARRGPNTIYAHHITDEIESYNLFWDPYQLTASKQPDQAKENRLDALKKCKGASCG
jgi:N-acetylglucosamine-6-sulfatase